LKRHAKNRLRWVKGTAQEAEAVVANPIEQNFDSDGNPRYRGFIAGKRCRVVVAADDPDLIISIHFRRRR
jgi:hypothetical protein